MLHGAARASTPLALQCLPVFENGAYADCRDATGGLQGLTEHGCAQADESEMSEARFFEWEPLLQSWIDAGKPKNFALKGRKVSKYVLTWLETWKRGGALKCRLEEKVLDGGMKGATQAKVLVAM